MALSRLGGRGEDGFSKAVAILQPSRQGDATDFTPCQIFLEATAGDIATHYTFNRQHPGLAADHDATLQLVFLLLIKHLIQAGHGGQVCGYKMVASVARCQDISQQIKPEG